MRIMKNGFCLAGGRGGNFSCAVLDGVCVFFFVVGCFCEAVSVILMSCFWFIGIFSGVTIFFTVIFLPYCSKLCCFPRVLCACLRVLFACWEAYCEWRRAVQNGTDELFCDEHGLSPETMDMADMMAQQFISFMVEAGYDGDDVQQEEPEPVKRGSVEDALLRCALTAGFAPNFCTLYKGARSPYWWRDDNAEVHPFAGSVNKDIFPLSFSFW